MSPAHRSIARVLLAIPLALSLCFPVFSQVVEIPFEGTSAANGGAATSTFVWSTPHALATMVFIPGGEGRLALGADRKNLGGFYGDTLKPLADPRLTRGRVNVVVFDSPNNLPVGTDYPYSRRQPDHLLRIDSVVRHYRQKFGLPIWLMGHSNGAASVTEYFKMLQTGGREGEVAGMVYSSAREGADFREGTQLPVLFLAHELDACLRSRPARARAVYERLKQSNSRPLDFVWIKSGEAEAKNVCASGFHMFNGAGLEAARAIDDFIASVQR